MNLVCNYCFPPPPSTHSLSLIHSIYIIVKESYSQNHSFTTLPRTTGELVTWQNRTLTPRCSDQEVWTGEGNYLGPQFGFVTTRTQNTHTMLPSLYFIASSLLENKFLSLEPPYFQKSCDVSTF